MEITIEQNINQYDVVFNQETTEITVEIVNQNIVYETTVEQLGIQGYSAYEIAAQEGFTGTKQQWLNSLQSVGIPDYIQTIPSNTWIVNHNTNKKRSLELFTVGGMKMSGDVQIINDNQTIATFLQPIAGFAKVI